MYQSPDRASSVSSHTEPTQVFNESRSLASRCSPISSDSGSSQHDTPESSDEEGDLGMYEDLRSHSPDPLAMTPRKVVRADSTWVRSSKPCSTRTKPQLVDGHNQDIVDHPPSMRHPSLPSEIGAVSVMNKQACTALNAVYERPRADTITNLTKRIRCNTPDNDDRSISSAKPSTCEDKVLQPSITSSTYTIPRSARSLGVSPSEYAFSSPGGVARKSSLRDPSHSFAEIRAAW